jgi:hypothetical protein
LIPTASEVKEDNQPKLLPQVWTSQDQLERALAFVQEQYAKSYDDHQGREVKWLEWDNIYRLIDKQKPTDGGCNIVDPEPQIEVEVLKANYVEAFFGQDPNFEYQGVEDSDDKQAEIMSAYRAESLRRIALREKFERTVHQLLVYGTCVVKTPYKIETTKRKFREKVVIRDEFGNVVLDAKGNKKVKIVTNEYTVPKFADTDWEYVSLYDFFPVGKGCNEQEIEGLIHRIKIDWDSLKSRERKTSKTEGGDLVEGIYYNLDSIEPFNDGTLVEYWGRIPKWVLTGDETDRFRTFEGLISCVLDLDESGKLAMRQSHSDRTGEVNSPAIVPNSPSACVRFQENPYWHGERPFMLCPYIPVDDELYGIGLIEPITEKWNELNTTIRQVVDNKTLQLLNPTIEDVHANVQRDIKLIKFPRIKADDVNAVVPLPINDFSNNGYKVISSIKDDMRKSSGALDTITGVPLNQDRTSATEFQGVAQQAGVRLKNRIRIIEEKLFKKFLDRSYQNDMQFTTFERIIRVVGKEGVYFQRVRPEDIWGTFDIVTYGPTNFENKVQKINKLTNFFAIAAKAPQFFNIPELAKKIYVGMEIGPEHDADNIVNTPPEEAPQEQIDSENTALALGQGVFPHKSDNHHQHIMAHMAATKNLATSGIMDEMAYRAFESHVNQHIQMMQMQPQMAGNGQMLQNGPMGGVAPSMPSVGEAPNPMMQVGQ